MNVLFFFWSQHNDDNTADGPLKTRLQTLIRTEMKTPNMQLSWLLLKQFPFVQFQTLASISILLSD